jgi:O-antigen/teichoic acid export membrane protein
LSEGLNTLILYPKVLEGRYYGMVIFLLSASNIIMPLITLGVNYTIVKFFSSYESKTEKDKFLSVVVLFPLLTTLPIAYLVSKFYEQIGSYLSSENTILKNYTFVIFIVAISCTYFEVFYSWAKVQMKSVFGNFLKELWNRLVVLTLLTAVGFNLITKSEFIYFLTGAYVLRFLVMMIYALWLYLPIFTFKIPKNFQNIFKYSLYMLLAGSAGAILLDIDKVMIPSKEEIELAAYYAVAVFIGTVIEVPGRAMSQILQPITSKTINENNNIEVENLYKKSSVNLLLIGGLFFLIINCGIHELFKLMPDKGYAGGELVVLMISSAKLFTMFLGNNGTIINNSSFYRISLPLNLGMALSVYFLNIWLFDIYGTNGLALATLIVILIFNSFKLFIIKRKLHITPATPKTLVISLLIILLFFLFYFWNFSFHPAVNILVKSSLIAILYVYTSVKFNLSEEINLLLLKMKNKIFN